ncbi:unnamed protein product [Brassicogethes aeneus]|uniref:Uncharacterized protein n=1 Tax=Brassicogethes aeneus TaxID=1431903 RepID=A0A9P0B2X2_BRAAE|nr:unnamed protein product [Brassicogethes aeneus]
MFKVVLVLCLLAVVSSLHIPSFIKACSKSDPNFNDCALEQTKAAYPSISKGDKQFKAPPLNPFFMPLIEVDTGPNLALKMKELTVKGLDNAEFTDVKFDLEKNKAHLKLSTDLNFDGSYDINGQILVLPITGSGHCNITFSHADFEYVFEWDVIDKDGKKYANVKDAHLDLKLKRAYFLLENLFNGDKLLGDNMNMVLNDNWEEVMKEVGAGINHTIEVVVTNILKAYFEKIPYNEMFVD